MNNLNTKFDFDDILIVPSKISDITSRYKDIALPEILPLFTAPMDTVVNLNNIDDYIDNGIMVCLPRTIKIDEFNEFLFTCRNRNKYNNVFLSFGFDDLDEFFENEWMFQQKLHRGFHMLIDVANAHMLKVVNYVNRLTKIRPDIIIMIGNIGNPETYLYYAENTDVQMIRCGIGNGNACLSTKNSGIGYPIASLIHEIRGIKDKFENENKQIAPMIIADGGMKNYSDIIKSFYLGADMVMVGSIFNKSIESSGENYFYGLKINVKLAKFLYRKGFKIVKHFRGMSTKSAQKAMGKTVLKTSEGVVRYVPVEYSIYGWIENFKHYLRNSMSYSNSHNLDEFIGNNNFIEITKHSYDRFNK